ncbi:GNAT family N-acetyltransferase [Streptomyces sp. NPDC005904]|uniref:GNAT family N-acetyltransferase n=1 Tax=Streptomyces sp. NPDC005904 TaxID=3154570 RepID=UPI00340C6606
MTPVPADQRNHRLRPEQGFITMLTVAPTTRRQGVGARLLKATEAACTSSKLFT